MDVSRQELLIEAGRRTRQAPTAWRLVDIEIDKQSAAFAFALDRKKLRAIRRREGRYLLRTNLADDDPALLWQYYIQLVAVEEAFKNLKGDLAIRPIFHKDERRIEAISSSPSWLTPCRSSDPSPPRLGPGADRPKRARQVRRRPDDRCPSPDNGRTRDPPQPIHPPEPELQLLISPLKLHLPPQPPPTITTSAVTKPPAVVKTFASNSLIINEQGRKITPIREDRLSR